MKITGVKKAISAYRNRQYVRIMVDRSTGEVWADEFADENSFIHYDSPAICSVSSAFSYEDFYNVNMATVRAAAERLCAEWAAEEAGA